MRKLLASLGDLAEQKRNLQPFILAYVLLFILIGMQAVQKVPEILPLFLIVIFIHLLVTVPTIVFYVRFMRGFFPPSRLPEQETPDEL